MLTWQVLLAGPLAVVGVLTVRAGWLGGRGRLGAGARAASVPLLVAGAVAVLGAVVAVLQPTVAAMVTVAVIAWAGAVGLSVAARRLTVRTVRAPVPAGCAGCPLTGAERTACCAGRPAAP